MKYEQNRYMTKYYEFPSVIHASNSSRKIMNSAHAMTRYPVVLCLRIAFFSSRLSMHT